MTSLNDTTVESQPYAAWIGLDWADQKHFWSMRTVDGKLQRGQLDNTPEAIEVWAAELARQFGGRPVALALEQAGAFIAQKRSSLADYLARWRQHDKGVRKWNDERLTKYPRAVVTTWDTTVDQLSPEGLALLRQLSWLAPEPIPRSILPDGLAQDALVEIASFSLAKFEEGGGNFRIHRLVQDVTRERQSDEEKDQSLRSMLEIFNKVESGNPQDVRSWTVWDPLRPHLSSVTTYADQYGIADPTTSLMNQLAVLLLAKASYGDAEPLMRRALASDEATYGPGHPNVAIRLNNLAQLLKDTNRLTDAEPLMQRALAIDEASYEPDHPNVARDLNNLALLLRATNRLDDAEPLMQRHLVILFKFTRSTGHVHPLLKQAYANYRALLQAMNLSDEEVGRRLLSPEVDAGFDEGTYRSLLMEILR